jgi:two-component system, sensor histidine kinase and response regulator
MSTAELPELIDILLIDDDDVDRMAVRRALRRAGYQCRIVEAADGNAGIAAMRQQSFDCVFLDYQLPRQNGLQILRKIHENGLNDAPVIMLTGHGDEKVAVELMKAGAVDYIPKDSMNAGNLWLSLKNAIRVRRAEQQAAGAEAALRRYAAELEARNQELDAFAGTVAHDLKGALTPVLGFAQLLEKHHHEGLGEEGLHITRNIIRSGNKGLQIIDSLMLLTRLRYEMPQMTRLDMGAIVKDVLEQVNLLGREATIQTPDSWPDSLGYAPWVEAIWTNYISNAIKYGGRPPLVVLGATAEPDGYVRFWTRDNGPGLTPREREMLFTPFTRLNQDRADGHGLGLTIVERIAKKLNGRVGVESAPQEGSTFWFALPVE